jgi:hypothetical protein
MSTFNTLLVFKGISLIFATASVFTGAQAILDPIAFSKTFGIEIPKRHDTPLLRSYVTLMATRQLATGITILLLARQGHFIAIAYILMVAGVVVAGTDGIFIAKMGSRKMGIVHAGPGFLIASIATLTIWQES